MQQKVKDAEHLFRDSGSNAIINNDMSGLLKAKARQKKARQKDSRLEELESRMETIESQLSEITKLLKNGLVDGDHKS